MKHKTHLQTTNVNFLQPYVLGKVNLQIQFQNQSFFMLS